MADLLDIAPTTAVEVVNINGEPITVRSLGAGSIASLARRFPDVITMLFMGGFGSADAVPKYHQLGAAIAPIIAAGCGHTGDEKYEMKADTAFLVEDQLKLVSAIIGITFPNGFGFLEEMVKQLTEKLLAGGGEAKAHKVRSRNSPSPSPLSSDEASRPNMQ